VTRGSVRGFLDLLLDAGRAGSRLRVVVAVRADLFGHCAAHRAFVDVCRDATLLVGPMIPAELREVIVRPAMAEGLVVERSLTARLVPEVSGEPGGLPLLSHALLEIRRWRRGRTLTEAAYDAVGGVRGAVARTAEHTYARLTDAQAALAPRVLLRLITPGDGTQDTRRSVRRAELAWGGTTGPRRTPSWTVWRGPASSSSTKTPSNSPTRICSRLRDWVTQDRERLRLHRQLTEAARTWEILERDAGALYRGTRLAAVRDWTAPGHGRVELNATERAFLDARVSPWTTANGPRPCGADAGWRSSRPAWRCCWSWSRASASPPCGSVTAHWNPIESPSPSNWPRRR